MKRQTLRFSSVSRRVCSGTHRSTRDRGHDAEIADTLPIPASVIGKCSGFVQGNERNDRMPCNFFFCPACSRDTKRTARLYKLTRPKLTLQVELQDMRSVNRNRRVRDLRQLRDIPDRQPRPSTSTSSSNITKPYVKSKQIERTWTPYALRPWRNYSNVADYGISLHNTEKEQLTTCQRIRNILEYICFCGYNKKSSSIDEEEERNG